MADGYRELWVLESIHTSAPVPADRPVPEQPVPEQRVPEQRVPGLPESEIAGKLVEPVWPATLAEPVESLFATAAEPALDVESASGQQNSVDRMPEPVEAADCKTDSARLPDWCRASIAGWPRFVDWQGKQVREQDS